MFSAVTRDWSSSAASCEEERRVDIEAARQGAWSLILEGYRKGIFGIFIRET